MKKASIFKTAIVGLAIINLIALFVFEYEVPEILRFWDKKDEVVMNESDDSDESAYSITFDSEELVYDGTAELNLMSGVTVNGPEGTVTDLEVFANIVTADSLNEKEVVYSIDAPDGQVTASRKLTLVNYTGPSLVLPETMPEVEEADLATYVTLMPTDGTFAAKDGYGKDITAQVSADYTIDAANPTVVHFVFSVINMFNDKVSVPYDLTIDSNRPILVLKQSSVTVAKGGSFQPLDYIEKAETQSGADLLHTVAIEGSVDMNTPGKYSITYTVEDNGIKSVPQKLEVVVE